jgi:hypothetical protein
MSSDIQAFVNHHPNTWPKEMLGMLINLQQPEGKYGFSWELAAKLEAAKAKLLTSDLAIAVSDARALKDVDPFILQQLQDSAQYLRIVEQSGADAATIQAVMTQHQQLMVMIGAAIKPGGGCGGTNNFEFQLSADFGPEMRPIQLEQLLRGAQAETNLGSSKQEGTGEEGFEECQTPGCPNNKRKTRVGGCSVCLDKCQLMWNKDINPAKVWKQPAAAKPAFPLWLVASEKPSGSGAKAKEMVVA